MATNSVEAPTVSYLGETPQKVQKTQKHASKAAAWKADLLKDVDSKGFDEVFEEKKRAVLELHAKVIECDAIESAVAAEASDVSLEAALVCQHKPEMKLQHVVENPCELEGKEINRKFLEATQILSMMEMMAEKRKKATEMETKRREAQETAYMRKRCLVEKREREMHALHAARKSMRDDMMTKRRERIERVGLQRPCSREGPADASQHKEGLAFEGLPKQNQSA